MYFSLRASYFSLTALKEQLGRTSPAHKRAVVGLSDGEADSGEGHGDREGQGCVGEEAHAHVQSIPTTDPQELHERRGSGREIYVL